MASTKLTKGSIARYKTGDTQQSPIVKITNVRVCGESSTAASNDSERYRLSISDGQDTFDACVLSPDLNKLIKEKRLHDNSIVQLEKVVHNSTATGKSFLIIMDLIILPESSTTTTSNNNNNNKQANTNICPIAMITPYLNGIWKIRARCFAKSAIRPHPVCDFDFVDASGEIRLVAFRDECTRFHPMIEIDKIYDIMGVRVKTADKRWNTLHNDYELTLNSGSIVRLVNDPSVNTSIPDVHYDFIPLQDVSKHTSESYIDVIGIIDTCSDAIPFTSKTSGKDSKRRELTLIDEHTSMSVTLWDDQAEDFDEELAENKTVVAFRRIRVAIYNNKYGLSGSKNMIMKINPDLKEAKHLRIWYDAGGHSVHSQITTTTTPTRPALDASWKTIGQIENEELGRKGRPDYVMLKATCMHIADNRVIYMSCPNDGCSKKVNKLSSALYRCDKCQQDFNECHWTYMFRAELTDSTGAIWASFFGQPAEQLMGYVTAEQFADAKENADELLMQKYLNKNTFREKIFRLRINEETFNDITTVKISCISISDIDFSDYGHRLIANIQNGF
ncbi:unnamed protein product [Adineta steineri]|uniref:Replication protein A subunit n=1 Tax=Adineta steineri TaxID=433720 RepID=A0A815IY45_9BILA|nr:unnamed protein product [Adineta steineri]CAF1533371.1 unnamed protein product [Adineta steineri]